MPYLPIIHSSLVPQYVTFFIVFSLSSSYFFLSSNSFLNLSSSSSYLLISSYSFLILSSSSCFSFIFSYSLPAKTDLGAAPLLPFLPFAAAVGCSFPLLLRFYQELPPLYLFLQLSLH